MHSIVYDDKVLLTLQTSPLIGYDTLEDWAAAYASESGLDREMDYNPELLEVVVGENK